jgi:hypothetical protein
LILDKTGKICFFCEMCLRLPGRVIKMETRVRDSGAREAAASLADRLRVVRKMRDHYGQRPTGGFSQPFAEFKGTTAGLAVPYCAPFRLSLGTPYQVESLRLPGGV